jgi:two-component system nitrate/nitrite response regulator NarL
MAPHAPFFIAASVRLGARPAEPRDCSQLQWRRGRFAAILLLVSLRTLIVDDNARFLAAASDLLEREGIRVVGVASTSEEAIRRAAELRPDVTLVDVYLGQESGIDLARRLSGPGDREQSPVILISTYAESDFPDLLATSPAVGFVSKADLSASAIQKALGN